MRITITHAEQNVTLDDTNLFITYSPSTSWHANTVACSSCLAPDPALAHSGTWHDGTHIVPTTDEDDEGTGGVPDSDGDGNGSSSSTSNSVAAATSSSSSSPSSTQSVTGGNTDNDDNDNGEDDDDSHKGKGGGKNTSRRFRRDDENPFEVQSLDSDDPGFQDVPVTASLTFTGTGIYVFAIIPLFPAPPDSTPTFTNLSFSLLSGSSSSEISSNSFIHTPDASIPGTPTVNSTTDEKFLQNVLVYSASTLNDEKYTLTMSVGVDSVFLLDYIIYTAGDNDDPIGDEASLTSSAPDSQRTAGNLDDGETRHHNVATFAGAVGGSVGFLGTLALGLCISIRYRRVRASRREARVRRMAYAEPFTAVDHGELPDDDDEAQRSVRNGATMRQAGPAPFVPRYFPGSTPASPPPYVADATETETRTNMMSITRAGVPVAVPSSSPPAIAMPTPILDLSLARSVSGGTSESYADRPPPTPPDEETRVSLFGALFNSDSRRGGPGGIVGPLPMDSPMAEESDPMLGTGFSDDDREEYRDEIQVSKFESDERYVDGGQGGSTSDGHQGQTSDVANLDLAVASAYRSHAYSEGASTPQNPNSNTDLSDSLRASSLRTSEITTASYSSTFSQTPPSTTDASRIEVSIQKPDDSLAQVVSIYPTLSSSTSLPGSGYEYASSLFSSNNQPRTQISLPNLSDAVDATSFPESSLIPPSTPKVENISSIAYPTLQPSRVPLPPSLHSIHSRQVSQETFEYHSDSGS